jgi:hypothetical protein
MTSNATSRGMVRTLMGPFIVSPFSGGTAPGHPDEDLDFSG